MYESRIEDFDFVPLFAAINIFCDKHGLAQPTAFDIHLVVEEVLTNIIRHGAGKKRKGTVRVSLCLQDANVRIKISDNTKAFDPLSIKSPDIFQDINKRNPGGLGIFLVKKKSKTISYQRLHGWNILEIRLAAILQKEKK